MVNPRKTPCIHCPSAHFPPDPEAVELLATGTPAQLAESLFDCAWDTGKTCRGNFDQVVALLVRRDAVAPPAAEATPSVPSCPRSNSVTGDAVGGLEHATFYTLLWATGGHVRARIATAQTVRDLLTVNPRTGETAYGAVGTFSVLTHFDEPPLDLTGLDATLIILPARPVPQGALWRTTADHSPQE